MTITLPIGIAEQECRAILARDAGPSVALQALRTFRAAYPSMPYASTLRTVCEHCNATLDHASSSGWRGVRYGGAFCPSVNGAPRMLHRPI